MTLQGMCCFMLAGSRHVGAVPQVYLVLAHCIAQLSS